MERAYTGSNNWVRLCLATLFGVVIWQAATRPFTQAEATAWYQVVRPRFSGLLVTPGAWSGLVYGLLAKRSVGLFRLSEFSLRLPDVACGAIYFASLYRTCRRWWLLGPLAITPVLMNCFSLAGGLGVALGLCAVAADRPRFAGAWLGLAVAVAPQAGWVPAVAALALAAPLGFWRGMERVIVPAVTVAFLVLLVPLSHGGAPVPQARGPAAADSAVRSAMGMLRAETGQQPARIASDPESRAWVEFYRERYGQRNWLVDAGDPQYFFWMGGDPPASGARPLAIVFQQAGVVLAR